VTESARKAMPIARVRAGFSVSHVHVMVHSIDNPWERGFSEDVEGPYCILVGTSVIFIFCGRLCRLSGMIFPSMFLVVLW